MMVDGRHPEKAFSSGMPEPEHLNDHGNDFEGINKTYDRDKERELEHIGHSGDESPQRQRPGISHKYLGRIGVIQQKSHQGSDHRRTGEDHSGGCSRGGNDKKDRDGYRHAAREPVHSVGKIRPVDCGHSDKHHDRNIQKAKIENFSGHKRNLHGEGHIVDLLYIKGKQKRDQHLQQKLLPGEQAVRSFFHYFDIIIGKADQSEADREDKDRDRVSLPPEGEKTGQCHSEQDHQPSHVRSSCLF